MLNKFKNLLSEEQGQGMTEYGLLLAVIVGVVLVAVVTLGDSMTTLMEKITDAIDDAIKVES